MSRDRFARTFGGGGLTQRPGYMPLGFGEKDVQFVEGRVAKAAAASLCHVPGCQRPAHTRVYVKGGGQIGACWKPWHQAAMRAQQWPRP